MPKWGVSPNSARRGSKDRTLTNPVVAMASVECDTLKFSATSGQEPEVIKLQTESAHYYTEQVSLTMCPTWSCNWNTPNAFLISLGTPFRSTSHFSFLSYRSCPGLTGQTLDRSISSSHSLWEIHPQAHLPRPLLSWVSLIFHYPRGPPDIKSNLYYHLFICDSFESKITKQWLSIPLHYDF